MAKFLPSATFLPHPRIFIHRDPLNSLHLIYLVSHFKHQVSSAPLDMEDEEYIAIGENGQIVGGTVVADLDGDEGTVVLNFQCVEFKMIRCKKRVLAIILLNCTACSQLGRLLCR